jgi:hypothetical protein
MEAWLALGTFIALFCAWVVLPSRILRGRGPTEEDGG